MNWHSPLWRANKRQIDAEQALAARVQPTAVFTERQTPSVTRSVRARLIASWVLLVGSIIGWPLSQLTIARHEPPFILGLSWLAIILTAADLLSTTDVRGKTEQET